MLPKASRRACIRILAGLLLLWASLAGAQTTWEQQTPSSRKLPPSAFKLISIEVTGSQRYQPEDIIAASGLHLGETVHEDDFKSAAERLGTSGAFSQVSYRFEYSPEGTKLQFQVADAPKFVPVEFDNLVWFPDAELMKQLHASVPLFHGELPLDGNLADDVDEALQAMVAGKGIPAEVDYVRAGPANGGITAFVFSVSGPEIQIGKVKFDGVAPAQQTLLEDAAQQMQGETYFRQKVEAQVSELLMPVYLERGFLKAKFSNPQLAVVQENDPHVTVDVTFSVLPGIEYKMAGVQWSGNKLFPAARLDSLIQLKIGQPANAVKLQQDLQNVQRLYATKGYMAAAITPKAVFDDPTASIHYILNVKEGGQYRMGEIDIGGLDRNTIDQLLLAWTLKNGQPYSSEYLKTYMAGMRKLLPPGNWKTTVHQTLNKDLTVDITLQFQRMETELQSQD
jgi:outer membrane protein insertion porin family